MSDDNVNNSIENNNNSNDDDEAVAASTLRDWAKSGHLSRVVFDGQTLTLDGKSLDAAKIVTIHHGDKSCRYSLASIYLQILDPNQSLMNYRKACTKHQVKDFVKALEKPIVVGYYLGGSNNEQQQETTTATNDEPGAITTAGTASASEAKQQAVSIKTPSTTATATAATAAASSDHHSSSKHKSSSSSSKHHHRDRDRSSSKDPHHRSSSDKDRHRHHRRDDRRDHRRDSKDGKPRHHSSSRDSDHHKSSSSNKKRKVMTNEQLFDNLNVVVGKRSENNKDKDDTADAAAITTTAESAAFRELRLALSAEGFAVQPDVLKQYSHRNANIIEQEIPVGDSASILRAAAGRDLTRVLELYNETLRDEKQQKSKGSKTTSTTTPTKQQSYLVGKKPIIVLPKSSVAPIAMENASEFFDGGVFIPRDRMKKNNNKRVVVKRNATITFSRKVGARFGGGKVEYELMDNPRQKIIAPRDWERVVAVICLGEAWQFKDWPGEFSNPVHLFAKTFGFYIGMEGVPLPKQLQGWNVGRGMLNRDKRGLDSVTYASFWNGLDEFMAVKKPEFLMKHEEKDEK